MGFCLGCGESCLLGCLRSGGGPFIAGYHGMSWLGLPSSLSYIRTGGVGVWDLKTSDGSLGFLFLLIADHTPPSFLRLRQVLH